MPRLVLLTLVGTVTVVLVRRDPTLVQRVGNAVGAGLSQLAESVAAFGADVHASMTAREHELRQAAGLPISPAA